MNITVLGLGRTGHTVTCYLMDRGARVTVWDRNPEKLAVIREKGINISGALTGAFSPQVEEDLGQAIAQAQYILIMTTAGGHLPVAKALRGLLRQGQRIIVFNANWGAAEFYSQLGEEAARKDVVLAETAGMLLMSQSDEVGQCRLQAVKGRMGLACIPSTRCGELVEEISPLFPQFFPMDNVLATSLNATNPVIHTAVNLFNLAAIENGADYFMYRESTTPLGAQLAERIDAERLAVMAAVGVPGVSCLDALNTAWGSHWEDLFTLLRNTEGYRSAKGPDSFDHRHFTEDIPFGLIPVLRLGQANNVPTPAIELTVRCYSQLLGRDWFAMAPDTGSLDLNALR